MAEKFLTYPTSYSALGNEMTRLIDAYKTKILPEAELREALDVWSSNVPDLFFAASDSKSTINPSLIRYIGKRRAEIITRIRNAAE